MAAITEGFEDDTLDVSFSGTWLRTSANSHSGSWSYRSADIVNGETSEAVLAVPPEKTGLQFWYSVSSEEGFDRFTVINDIGTVILASGAVEWTQSSIIDVSDAANVTFRYAKDGSGTEGTDATWIDEVVLYDSPPLDPQTEDFEDAEFVFGITGDWFRTTARSFNGSWSFRSADIADGETSDALVTVPSGAQSMEFWLYESSEAGYDTFQLLVDGNLVFTGNGFNEWTTHLKFDVAGATNVTLRYAKDGSVSSDDDAAYVDDLKFLVDQPTSSTPVTVTAVPAAATGNAPAPTVTAATSVSAAVTARPATATAGIVAASVSTTARIGATPAQATATAPSPTVTTTAAVAPLAAPATGTSPPPQVTATRVHIIRPPPAAGAGEAPAPKVSASTVVAVTAAEASGGAPSPTVTTGGTVTALSASATASAPAPSIGTAISATVRAPAADAAGDGSSPGVTSIAVVPAPSAAATAAAPRPSVRNSSASIVTTSAAAGSGTAAAPEIAGSASVSVGSAAAAGASVAPEVATTATISATAASATAFAPAPISDVTAVRPGDGKPVINPTSATLPSGPAAASVETQAGTVDTALAGLVTVAGGLASLDAERRVGSAMVNAGPVTAALNTHADTVSLEA